ncbi:hypothetical protein B0T20DRAFT_415935 [Sordaria brevicollis]|uniref:Uncharacterized protein n=1 Tax=Sordaria brevicollis TaxID=83679 RepID=A0AAE0PCC2_SORBR|nr:hypothetical protein B0T20DRAFT_415935 [Sordaria brevicollis]
MAAAFRSVTVITTLVTSTPTTIVPRQQLLEVVPDASNPSPPIVTTISPSLHLIHQSRQESNSDNDTDDDDGWKYAVRLYACGYRSGNFVEAIRPPPDQICVLDLRSGLYGFCKDPGEGTGGRLDLKRDCSGWRGGCVDAFGCKEAECGAVGSGKGRNRFSEVETW